MQGHQCKDWLAPALNDGDVVSFCIWCAWLAEHHEHRRLRVRVAELERFLEQTLQQLDRQSVPR